jgi:hypothetical protein
MCKSHQRFLSPYCPRSTRRVLRSSRTNRLHQSYCLCTPLLHSLDPSLVLICRGQRPNRRRRLQMGQCAGKRRQGHMLSYRERWCPKDRGEDLCHWSSSYTGGFEDFSGKKRWRRIEIGGAERGECQSLRMAVSILESEWIGMGMEKIGSILLQ